MYVSRVRTMPDYVCPWDLEQVTNGDWLYCLHYAAVLRRTSAVPLVHVRRHLLTMVCGHRCRRHGHFKRGLHETRSTVVVSARIAAVLAAYFSTTEERGARCRLNATALERNRRRRKLPTMSCPAQCARSDRWDGYVNRSTTH